eukprot:GDKI01028279.1.p1 GENE.GDKI01028279.1~~GDKI01028279.1.p1  ORF type:complete len:124 (-),score=27.88 GDKI01028279.1:66-437(-)
MMECNRRNFLIVLAWLAYLGLCSFALYRKTKKSTYQSYAAGIFYFMLAPFVLYACTSNAKIIASRLKKWDRKIAKQKNKEKDGELTSLAVESPHDETEETEEKGKTDTKTEEQSKETDTLRAN